MTPTATAATLSAAFAAILVGSCAVAAETEPAEPEFLITGDALGPIHMGMTMEELIAAMPDATIEHEPYFSGEIAEAECIVIDGERVACVTLYPPFDGSSDVPVIDYIFTASPRARTAEGVGPGTPLADAEAAYGEATAQISIIESREYVEFADHPHSLSFRIGALDEDVWRAGIYDNDDDSHGSKTSTFRDDAVVMFVEF